MSSGGDYSKSQIDDFAIAWWRRASSLGTTNDKDGRSTVEAVRWLFRTYDRNRSSAISDALARVDGMAPIIEAAKLCRRHREQVKIVRLATFCRAMQAVVGGDYYLSCRDAAMVAGVSPRTANVMLKKLFGEFVQLVADGTP